jgi:hypothetical protein
MLIALRLLFAAALVAAAHAGYAAEVLPFACASAIIKQMPDWKPIEPARDAADWAHSQGANGVVASGDFDGNGVRDWAALGTASGRAKLSVCMNVARRLKLVVIEDPYCDDLVLRTPAGSTHYKLETSRRERIRHDGISVLCFEQAGATYVHGRSGFRRIIDSD